jgi:hypothetical protein
LHSTQDYLFARFHLVKIYHSPLKKISNELQHFLAAYLPIILQCSGQFFTAAELAVIRALSSKKHKNNSAAKIRQCVPR